MFGATQPTIFTGRVIQEDQEDLNELMLEMQEDDLSSENDSLLQNQIGEDAHSGVMDAQANGSTQPEAGADIVTTAKQVGTSEKNRKRGRPPKGESSGKTSATKSRRSLPLSLRNSNRLRSSKTIDYSDVRGARAKYNIIPESTLTATKKRIAGGSGGAIEPRKRGRKPGSTAKTTKTGKARAGQEFEVEKIVASRIDRKTGKHLYQVRWAGYGKADDTWEPKTSLGNCEKLVATYERANGKAK